MRASPTWKRIQKGNQAWKLKLHSVPAKFNAKEKLAAESKEVKDEVRVHENFNVFDTFITKMAICQLKKDTRNDGSGKGIDGMNLTTDDISIKPGIVSSSYNDSSLPSVPAMIHATILPSSQGDEDQSLRKSIVDFGCPTLLLELR
ncbi:hypothetical protein V6N13_073913 [Hibiscus sabdariffa]|uniref:Uncharacterized protein n=1 Tax=Hibiscus sabdariffa TaxID=183260 RepID=A0ABR2U768_9ROSI